MRVCVFACVSVRACVRACGWVGGWVDGRNNSLLDRNHPLRCRRLVLVHKGNVTLTTIGVGGNICRYKKGERSWMR